MGSGGGDIDLALEELRLVARYVAESAEEVLPVFEGLHPDDHRPRAAIDAAREFVAGAARSGSLRTRSLDAHRAARSTTTEPARLAAQAAGDAASAAYLHPIARATQVKHILRAAAGAARIAEILAGGDPDAAERSIRQARRRATPELVDVLRRYPRPVASRSRVSQLMTQLDDELRRA